MTLRVPQSCLDQIRAAGEAAYPQEACGLLIGAGEEISEVIAAANVSETPDRAFEVDPQTLIHWQKKLRGTDKEVVGHYHSHPDHPARPSERDRARITEEGQVWAILTVSRAGAREIRFYRVEGGDFTPLEISVF